MSVCAHRAADRTRYSLPVGCRKPARHMGKYGGDWAHFVKYAGEVNWYLPAALVPAVAVLATVFETTFGVLLVSGWQVRRAAAGSAALLMLFALAMFSRDPKSPFDYSVFTAAFGALTLVAHADIKKKEKD
jgi:putative oxidoreductase